MAHSNSTRSPRSRSSLSKAKVNPFTAMMPLEKKLSCERISSKHTALKVDVIGAETILFYRRVRASVQPGYFTGWGSEGVKRDRAWSPNGWVAVIC